MQGLSGPLCCVARLSPGAWGPPVLLLSFPSFVILGFNNLVGSPLKLCGCSTIRVDTFVWRTTWVKFYLVLIPLCYSSSLSSFHPSQGKKTLDLWTTSRKGCFWKGFLCVTVGFCGTLNIRKLPFSQTVLYSLSQSSSIPPDQRWCCAASKVSTSASQHLLVVRLIVTLFLAHVGVTLVTCWSRLQRAALFHLAYFC